MSWLVTISEREPRRRSSEASDERAIAAALAPWGIRFERWSPERDSADALEAHAGRIARLRAEGYGAIDVVRVAREPGDASFTEKARAMREKFRDEHTHAEDEVRFFAEGTGVFYLRLGGDVYCVGCEAGDLLSVPAGTRHWFDMGAEPRFTAVRFFESADGWVGSFTGDAIARRLPSFEDLTAQLSKNTGAAAGDGITAAAASAASGRGEQP